MVSDLFYIRRLDVKDAKGMLEWMQDPQITCFFKHDFRNADIEDCINFIIQSQDDINNIHFALTDNQDNYLGTISLKNIDYCERNAEYAICLRKCAHGTNAALIGTQMVIEYAFNILDLKRVYLNVMEDNIRANAFYKKVGFHFWYEEQNPMSIRGIEHKINWYLVQNEGL